MVAINLATTLTGPVTEGLLNQPTGTRLDLMKSQVEANLASAQQRTEGPAKPTESENQRDSDISVLNNEKATSGQKDEARNRLRNSQDLFGLSTANAEQIDKEFSDIMKKLTDLRVKAPGDVLDKMFGKEAFDQGLKESIEKGLLEGVDPESMKVEFEKWWDKQCIAEKGQKFQDRSEFVGD